LARAHRDIDKWLLPARQFASAALALDGIFVLADGDEFSVAPVSRAEAMIELMRHTYYAEQFTGLHGVPQHMKVAGSVANVLPVQRLTRPKDWSRLDELVHFIEALAR
jgi:hypothetical protein